MTLIGLVVKDHSECAERVCRGDSRERRRLCRFARIWAGEHGVRFYSGGRALTRSS